jgi:hypothetical protein
VILFLVLKFYFFATVGIKGSSNTNTNSTSNNN